MRKKRRKYYKYRENEKINRSPILGWLTPFIIARFLCGVVILRILIIIAVLLIGTHLLNKKTQRYKSRIRATILSYVITIGIITGSLYYGYTKVGVIYDKFNEIGNGFSKIINLGQSKKGNFEPQLNKLGIMQEVLNNIFQNIGQVQ